MPRGSSRAWAGATRRRRPSACRPPSTCFSPASDGWRPRLWPHDGTPPMPTRGSSSSQVRPLCSERGGGRRLSVKRGRRSPCHGGDEACARCLPSSLADRRPTPVLKACVNHLNPPFSFLHAESLRSSECRVAELQGLVSQLEEDLSQLSSPQQPTRQRLASTDTVGSTSFNATMDVSTDLTVCLEINPLYSRYFRL